MNRANAQQIPVQWRRRRGAILVYVACLMPAFFALAALIIDLGMLRGTQSEMNTAADASALEGLRWRDQLSPEVTDTTNLDQARREEVDNLLQYLWDSNYGLGPEFDYTPSSITAAAQIGAGGTLVPATQDNGAVVTYQPGNGSSPPLQYNLDNDLGGDMLAGQYVADVSHAEADDFSRLDFDAADQSAFLVRFRRSNDTVASADNPAEGVSSTGPTLPLMFGQGALVAAISPPGDPATFPYRLNGFTVRSASIASATPTVYVGTPILSTDGLSTVLAGVIPLAIRRDFWLGGNLPAAGANGATTPVPGVASDGNGNLTLGTTPVGYLCNAQATMIGNTITSLAGATVPANSTGYAPIIDDSFSDGPGVWHVIGFAYVQATNVGGNITLTNLAAAAGSVAPRNASGNLRSAWAALGLLSVADQNAIMTENAALAGEVLSPVLVRSRGD